MLHCCGSSEPCAWNLSKHRGMRLTNFKLEIAEGLCRSGEDMQRNGDVQEKKKKGLVALALHKNVQLSGVGHFPVVMEKMQCCKYP